MKNFAHRGLFNAAEEENTLVALERALLQGFDIETDLRWRNGEFLIKHDEPIVGEELPRLFAVINLINKYPDRSLALHFKYDDWRLEGASGVIDEISECLDRVYLFDMSLEFCERLKSINPNVQVGVSVGDKKYHDGFSDLEEALQSRIDFIWADEYRVLYSESLIDACHGAGKQIFCISPDLAGPVSHPRAKTGYAETWRDLIRWEVDGICTDHSLELRALSAQKIPLH